MPLTAFGRSSACGLEVSKPVLPPKRVQFPRKKAANFRLQRGIGAFVVEKVVIRPAAVRRCIPCQKTVPALADTEDILYK